MKALRLCLSLSLLPFIAAAAFAQNSGGVSGATANTGTIASPGSNTVAVPMPVTPLTPEIFVALPTSDDTPKPATGETKISLDIGFGIRFVPPSRVSVPTGEKLQIVAPFVPPVVVSGATGAASGATTGSIASGQFIWTKNGVAIPGAISSVLVIDSVQSSDAGTYACLLSTPTTLPQPSQSLVLGVGPTSRLVNVSIRGALPAGLGESFIAGFVVAGTTPKKIVVRAVGATLARFDVARPLQRPLLGTYDATGHLLAPATNTATYEAELAAALTSVGAFPIESGHGDAMLLLSLDAGAYTAQVTSADGGGGEVLVEIYEVP